MSNPAPKHSRFAVRSSIDARLAASARMTLAETRDGTEESKRIAEE